MSKRGANNSPTSLADELIDQSCSPATASKFIDVVSLIIVPPPLLFRFSLRST
ncbi:hypothetical protein WN55_10943 [Dufourea novaeangliae]|uniref:Uncharacterized protein n=1 Tax=Dufourea novaeangliae TaxID=178035 RepID=A0A154PAJ5_DUFNO|nr:hypothetical protein WN55_10943 [Dufourea novaeangliae]